MEQERKLSKIEKQLTRREEKQKERALRRSQELEQGICRPDGLIAGTPRNMLQQIIADLQEEEFITKARLDDITLPIRHTDGTLQIAIEFCPVYTHGTTLTSSKLDKDVMTEEDVRCSRVGNKWKATTIALEKLQAVCKSTNTQLIVHATFADIGVMVEKTEDQDVRILRDHETAYKKLIEELCRRLGLPMDFKRLSDIQPLSQAHKVPQFLVTSEGRVLDGIPLEEELIFLLGRTSEEIPLKHNTRGKTLLGLLATCSNNIELLKGMVDTYLNYPTTIDCDMHLGIERGEGNLALQVLHKDSDTAKIPKLNIIVS